MLMGEKVRSCYPPEATRQDMGQSPVVLTSEDAPNAQAQTRRVEAEEICETLLAARTREIWKFISRVAWFVLNTADHVPVVRANHSD